jgi:hypothetical protein
MDLSGMQKYRYLQYLIYWFLFQTAVYSQTQKWYNAYLSNDMMALQTDLEKNNITDPDWKLFVQTIFIEDVEEALPQFTILYQKTADPKLKKIILDRISQYYYAKGFYETADRILTDENFRNQIISVREEQIYFGIQLGAFSSLENAEKAKKKYSGSIQDIYIITKESSGKKLYAVIAGKFKNRNDAEKLEKEIQKKFTMKGMITQY